MASQPDSQSGSVGSSPTTPTNAWTEGGYCQHKDNCHMFWWRCRFFYLIKEVAYLQGDVQQFSDIPPHSMFLDRVEFIIETLRCMQPVICPNVKPD